jgi:NO-binding membrane sensor protein with MHYT domain
MSDDTTSTIGRAFVTGLLILATLGFGLAGLCGAAFTVTAVPDMFSSRVENYSAAVLVIAVPSLLIGGGLAWWCGYRLAKRWRNDA